MVNVSRIKSLLRVKGVKIGYLCSQLGMNHSYLTDVEKGKAVMPEERIRKIADILGTTYEYLTDQIGDPRLPEEIEAEKIMKESKSSREEIAIRMSQAVSAQLTTNSNIDIDALFPFGLDSSFVTGSPSDMIAARLEDEFVGMYKQIALKKSSKEDLKELKKFMKYLIDRGE